ncbi:MAG: response regulator [Pseudomonadota bacterium]
MTDSARILIADDNPANMDILETRLAAQGYDILQARDGQEALDVALNERPDLALLDIMMPKIDGIELCRRLKSDAALPFMPIILVTAKSDPADIVAGLEAGAEEYLTKPVEQAALVARVKSMLRVKALHDQTLDQAEQLAAWNRDLEARVEKQVNELARLGALKSYFSPQVSELIVSPGNEALLESHRREITVVFCDLRGFTAFSESVEPDEIMAVLHDYHDAIGPLIFAYEATLEHFAGDGLMAFFNDPIPCDDPAERAVRMAVDMRDAMADLAKTWAQKGHALGFGVGIDMGYATLGQIGFEGRFHYGAIGQIPNVASRLSGRAGDGDIYITRRVNTNVETIAETEAVGELDVRGLSKPLPVFNVIGLKGKS